MADENELESAATWLQANNIKPLMEYLCAMCVLNRPEDPHAFVSALLRSKVKQRGGEEYDPSANTDLVRKCYSLAAESADENGRVRGAAAFQADEDDEDSDDGIDFGPGAGTNGGKSPLTGNVAKRVGNLEKVLSSSRRVGSTMNVASVALSIMEETQHMVGCAKVGVYMMDGATSTTMGKCDETTGVVGAYKQVTQYGIPGTVGQKGRALNLADAYQHASFDASEDQLSGFKTESLLAVPVPDPQTGRPMAVVVACNKTGASKFDRSDEEMMVVFAGQISLSLGHAMENETLSVTTKSQSNLLVVLNDLFTNNTISSEEQIVQYMITNGMKIVNSDKCLFYLIDSENTNQLWSMEVGESGESGKSGKSGEGGVQYFPTTTGILGYVATKVETINIINTAEDPRFDPSHDLTSGYKTETVLCMPLCDGRGQVVGVVQFLNKLEGDVFNSIDENTVRQMSCLIGPMIAALRNARSTTKK